VPLDIRELIQEATEHNIHFMAPSHELFNGNANADIYKLLVNNYITNIHE